MTPARVGPYELLEPLGEGGMGRVYRARDTRLGRIVALKFIRTQPGDRHRQLRFLREATVEAALSHPNIATILDVGEAEIDHPEISPPSDQGDKGPVPYLVLEFVPGQDLASLAHDGPLSVGELLRIGRQIAAGLHSAHSAGVIHRDLKPANIRVTPAGLVKILDFGLARFEPGAGPTSDALHEFATTEGSVVGTVPYLAPEQAAGQPIDARADLFSLGVLLYEMASGHLPFHGANAMERLRAVLRDDPPPLGQVAPQVPERLVRLVHRLLEKDPAARPQSAREVELEIDAIARNLSEGETSIDLPASAGERRAPSAISRLSTTRRWILGAVAALVLLSAAAAYLFDRQSLAAAERLVAEGRAAEELPDPQAHRIAAETFERATKLRPGLVSAWAALSHALTLAYVEERKPELLDRAESAAARAVELGPRSVDAVLARARITRLRGDARSAIRTLSALLERGEGVDRIERELAKAWEQVGDGAQAEQHLLAAVAAKGDEWGHWNALGDFRFQAGNYPGARAAFEKAASCAPAGVTTPAENLASVLFAEGKYTEALAAFEAIPGHLAGPQSASNRGTIYFFVGRFAEAERDYRDAIRMAPREPVYHRNLADTLLRLGRTSEARTEYAIALKWVENLLIETPNDPDLRLQRTLFLARAGYCDLAKRVALEIETQLPVNANTAHALARPFALCGEPGEAMARLRRAVTLGYPREPLQGEDELAPLRGLPEFELLIGR